MYCPECKPEDKTLTWRALAATVKVPDNDGRHKAVVIMQCGRGHTFEVDRPPNDANGNPLRGF